MFRFLRFFAAGVAITALLAVPFLISSATVNNQQVSVIVELNDDPGAMYKARLEKAGGSVSEDQLQAYRGQLQAKQDQFLAALASSGISATVMSRDIKAPNGSVAGTLQLRYTLVLNGIALKVPASAIDSIKGMSQVKAVHPDAVMRTSLDSGVKYIRAPEVYGGIKELGPFDDVREGYEGQGINIAVIDTGIDWTHPMFGDDPTPPRLGVAPPTPAATNSHKKVIYNLPLQDVVHDGFGHGTHVASTAAGYLGFAPGSDGVPLTADDVALHGVAPQARLMSYKVCSDILSTVSQVQPVGGCDTSLIVMAIEDSVSPRTVTGFAKPVAHVINMSLGGSGGPDNATALASDNAVRMGAVVVASAGNSGPGEGTVGAPAAGRRVIAVAANTNPGSTSANWSVDVLQKNAIPQSQTGAVTPARQFATASGFERVILFPMAGTPNPPADSLAQRYVLVTQPQTPAGYPASVRGRIALIKNTSGLPGGTFAQIANTAFSAGAVGVILISATENPTAVTAPIPSANIRPTDGEVLVDAMLSNDDNAVDPPAGTISELPIRMNPFFNDTFVGELAGFSSRGPVRGFGQVKPDVSAPGVDVLAAVPPASLLGALSLGNYGSISGTSMSGPHVAGVAALMKQAHPTWNADMIRTAIINTSTNMRNESGTPKAGGLAGDSVNDQGGGLVDVVEAIHAKALMGVTGDGLSAPTILGSHSYGEVPVINSRVTHTVPVTVTIRDVSGQGGTYSLAVNNNRDLQLDGINVSLSQSSVTVPAGGVATFTVNATVNGDLLRDVMAAKTIGSQVIFENLEMQWYVTADRTDGAESLRMPFYFKPDTTLPAQPIIETLDQTVIVPAADAGQQLVEGVTYVDVPFQVSASTYQIDALIEWFALPTGSVQDIDYQLLDPDGNVIASSGRAPGEAESVSRRVARAGTYTHRLVGFANAATEVEVTTTLSKGNSPPVLNAIAGDFTNAQGKPVDFDGSINLSWQATAGATGYEVERSTNGTSYEVVANTGADQTNATLANQPNGEISYRVRALAPGQIGSYVTAPSNVSSVIVDLRSKVDITSQVSRAISNVSLTNGVFQLDLAMTNNSAQAYVPLVDLNIVGISSASGTVRVINADNGKNGTSLANAALFGYSQKLGSDEVFTPAEATGTRTMRFQDSAFELFTFDAVVTAYVSGGGGGGEATAPQGGTPSPSGAGSTGLLTQLNAVIRFTANPLTRTVTAQLISLN